MEYNRFTNTLAEVPARIVEIKEVSVPMKSPEPHIADGFQLSDGYAVLELERDENNFYIGQYSADGNYHPTSNRYEPIYDDDCFITSFRQMEPHIERVINNSKVTDHHAIIPTVEIGEGHLTELSQGEKDILILIAQRLLCATAPRHIYMETRITAECSSTDFSSKGKTVTENGWKSVEAAFRRTLKNKEQDVSENEPELPVVNEGQFFTDVQASITDHFTTPPKPYTEDTLLSAMETAGNDHFDEDTEKKGLGTPATRAGILEKLVTSGYVKRKGKSLIPTDAGINLVAVMPEHLKSPKMTAEWENTLMQIERGEVTDSTFLQGISNLVTELISSHASINNDEKNRFATSTGKESIGSCPRCQAPVYEGKSNYYCSNRECSFCLWKNSTYLNNLKKPMTKKIATEFLQKGRVHGKGLYSSRTGKTFDADIVLTETTDKDGKPVASFKLEFTN